MDKKAEAVLEAAYVSAHAFRDGDREARLTTAILDAVWLAMSRHDVAQLEMFEREAVKYLATRKPSESWGPHVAWSGNTAAVIKELVARAETALKRPASTGSVFFAQLEELFPYLVPRKRVDREALKETLGDIALTSEGDARRFVRRALRAVGMTTDEVHRAFGFIRVAESRAHRRQKAARK